MQDSSSETHYSSQNVGTHRSSTWCSHLQVRVIRCLFGTAGVDHNRDVIDSDLAFNASAAPGANFAAVVRVSADVLESPSARAAAAVHGIGDDEILAAAEFPAVGERFLTFVEGVLTSEPLAVDLSCPDAAPLPPAEPGAVPTKEGSAARWCGSGSALLLLPVFFGCRRRRDPSVFTADTSAFRR